MSFIREHAKGVAHNIVANLLIAGGVGVISWYTAHQAALTGIPTYKAMLIGIVAFLVLALAYAAIAWGTARLRMGTDVPSPEPLAEPLPLLEQPSAQESPKRTIVEITPEELAGVYKVHSKEQAEKLLSAYLGAWIFASGITVKNYMYGPKGDETTIVLKTGDVHVYARFSDWHQAQPAHLAGNGVRIKVFGRVDEIEKDIVNLADCDLVEIKLPPPN